MYTSLLQMPFLPSTVHHVYCIKFILKTITCHLLSKTNSEQTKVILQWLRTMLWRAVYCQFCNNEVRSLLIKSLPKHLKYTANEWIAVNGLHLSHEEILLKQSMLLFPTQWIVLCENNRSIFFTKPAADYGDNAFAVINECMVDVWLSFWMAISFVLFFKWSFNFISPKQTTWNLQSFNQTLLTHLW